MWASTGQTSSKPVRRAYALVLGITDYKPAEDPGTEQDANMTTYDPLVCCVNDARFMRENLEDMGFQVEIHENLTGIGIKQKVATFVERYKRAASVDGAHGAEFLLYFSGHGFASSKGSPHVVGTDANSPGAQAVNLKKDFVCPLDKCCDGAAIVLLVDACMVAPDALGDDKERTTRLNGRGRPAHEVLAGEQFRNACDDEAPNLADGNAAAPGTAPYVPPTDAAPVRHPENGAAAAAPEAAPEPLNSISRDEDQPQLASKNNVSVNFSQKQVLVETTQLVTEQLSAPLSLSNPAPNSSSLYIIDTTLSNDNTLEPPNGAVQGSDAARAVSTSGMPLVSSETAECPSLQDTTQVFESATATVSTVSIHTISDPVGSETLRVRTGKDTGAILASYTDPELHNGMQASGQCPAGHNRHSEGACQGRDQQLPCINDMFAVASGNSELPRRLQQSGTTDTCSVAAASHAVVPPHSSSSVEIGAQASVYKTVSVDSEAATASERTAETAGGQGFRTLNAESGQRSSLYTPPDGPEDSAQLDATLPIPDSSVGALNDAERSATGVESASNHHTSLPIGATSLPAYRSEPVGAAHGLHEAGAASTPVPTTGSPDQNGERSDKWYGSLSNWAAFEGAHMGHAAPLKPPAPDATQRLSGSGEAVQWRVRVRGPSGARFQPPSSIGEEEPSSDIAPTESITQHAALSAGTQQPIYAVGYPPAMALNQEDRTMQDAAAGSLVTAVQGTFRMKSAGGTWREKGSYGKGTRAKTKTNMIVVSYPCGLGAPALEGDVMSLWTKVLIKHLHRPISITALLESAVTALHKQGQRPWMHFTPGFKAYSLAKGWLDADAELTQTDGVVQFSGGNKSLPTPQPSAPGTPATPIVAQPAAVAAATATTTSQTLREMAHVTGLAQALERSNESEADIQFLIARFDSLERRFREQQEQQSVLLQSFSLETGAQLTLTNELFNSNAFPSIPLANVESAPSPRAAAPAGAATQLSSTMLSSTQLDGALPAPPAPDAAPVETTIGDVVPAPEAQPQPAAAEFAEVPADASASESAATPAAAAGAAAPAGDAPAATSTAPAAGSTATPAEKPVPLVQAAHELLQRPTPKPLEAASAPLLVPRYMPVRTAPEVATPFDNPEVSGGANAVQKWAQDSLYTLKESSSTEGNQTGISSSRPDLEQTFPDFRVACSQTTQSSTPPSQWETPTDPFKTHQAHSFTTSSQTSLKTSFGISEPAPANVAQAPGQQNHTHDTTPSNDGDFIVEPPLPSNHGAAASDAEHPGVNSHRKPRNGKTSGTVHSLDTLCNVVSKYCSAVGRAAASQPPSTSGGRTRAPGPFVINLKNRSLSVDGSAQRQQRLPEEIQPREDQRFAAHPRYTSRGSFMAHGTTDFMKPAYSPIEPSSTGTTGSSDGRPSSPPTVQIMSNSVSSLSGVSRRPMVNLKRRGSFAEEMHSGPGLAPKRLPGASEYGAGSDSDSHGIPSHCFWSLTEMSQNAWCWTISGSGKIMQGSIDLPEGSFLFLGSGKHGKSPLYLDGMSIKGGTVVLMKGAKSVIMHKCKFGCPLIALDGANVQFEGCSLEGGHTGVGVFASGASTSVNISACRIRYFEECVVVEKGAQVTLSRSTLSYASLAGVEVRGREIPMYGAHAFGSQAPEGLAPMQEHPADLSQPFPMTPVTQTSQAPGSEAKAVVSLVLAEGCLFTDMHGSNTWDTSCVWAHAGGAAVLKESAIQGGVWGVCAQGAGTSAHVDGGEMRHPREGGVLVQGGACASVHCCKIFMHELHAELPMLASATGSIVGTSHKAEEQMNNSTRSSRRSSTQGAQSQVPTGRVEFDACMLPMMSRKSSSSGVRGSAADATPAGACEGWKTVWGAVMHGACGSVVSGNGFLDLDGCEISGGECGALLENSGAHAKISRTVVQNARSACIWANEKCSVKAEQSYLQSSLKGHGLWISGDGATGKLKKCVIEKHAGCGVLCEGSYHASVTAKECESRFNQECGFKAAAGAEIKLEQCISSDEVQKMQLGGRVSGSSRSAFSWLREQLHAGVASRGGWLAGRIHTSRRNNAS